MCPAPVECRPDRSDARRFGAIRPADQTRTKSNSNQIKPPLRSARRRCCDATFPAYRRAWRSLQHSGSGDTDLNLHSGSFSFGPDEPPTRAWTRAWAMGGWLEYRSAGSGTRSPWGRSGIPASPCYAPPPTTRTGPHCSRPARKGSPCSATLGQLRYRDYALLTGYRQMVDDGYMNSQDNRMLPNTFEGVTLKGKVGFVAYNMGYLWEIKPRNSDEFISMSQQAGGDGPSEGLVLTSLTLTPWKPLKRLPGERLRPERLQYRLRESRIHAPAHRGVEAPARSPVHGPAQRGERTDWPHFSTWNVGFGARLSWRGLALGTAAHFTATTPTSSRPKGPGPATYP